MPRRLRIEFKGAIYHVMDRGKGRQKMVRDDADRSRLLYGLEQTVVRDGWELLWDPKRIIAAVSAFYGLEEAALSRRHDPHVTRPVAAKLCRRHTEASLREMAHWLALSRADCVPDLTRRLEARLKASPELHADLIEILNLATEPAAGTGPASTASTLRRGDLPGRKQNTKLDPAKP